MRILSDDYFELLFINLSQEENYRVEGRTANCIFCLCVGNAMHRCSEPISQTVSVIVQTNCVCSCFNSEAGRLFYQMDLDAQMYSLDLFF